MSSDLVVSQYSPEQIDLLKRTICKDSTNDEFAMFVNQCKRTGLDPFAKQIHAVMRQDYKLNKKVMSIQVGIDGFRLVAQRSGDYEGQTPVQWCGSDGVWADVWLKPDYPHAAKVGVYRKGFRDALYATALWSEYHQGFMKDGQWTIGPMWKQMPVLMLAKCAEALALRKAYPAELSGLYSPEEMSQVDKNYSPSAVAEAVVERTVIGKVSVEPKAGGAVVETAGPSPSSDLPVSEAGGDEKSRYRQLRADLNNALINVGDSKGFQKAQSEFQKRHGKAIWVELTGHGKTETFDSLRVEHWMRIKDLVASVAGGDSAKTFLSRLIACTDGRSFQALETEYSNNKVLTDDAQITDALNEKGKALAVHGYEDLGVSNG
jgi:phage recombination protein Bet